MWPFSGTINVSIVGTRHYNEEQLNTLLGDSSSITLCVLLKPEPENKHDPDAIAAYLADGEQIGHVARDDITLLKGRIGAAGVEGRALVEAQHLSKRERAAYEKIQTQERALRKEISTELQFLRNADMPEKKRKKLYAAVEAKREKRADLDREFKRLYAKAQGLLITVKIKTASFGS